MPSTQRGRAIPRTISMYHPQWTLVEGVARERGNLSVSAALRVILAEWRQRTAAGAPVPRELLPAPGEQAEGDGQVQR